jgi:O-antigen/teichoic acid export membrane protein
MANKDSIMDKRRLAVGTLVHGASNILKIGLQLIVLPLMARLVGPGEYGLYTTAMPAILLTMTLADGGFGASLARESAADTELWSSALWMLVGAGIFLAGITSLASLLLAVVANEARLPAVMTALSGCLIMYTVSVPFSARLIRAGRIAVAPIGDIVANIVGAICAVALALVGMGVWSLVVQALATYGVRSLFAITLGWFKPKLSISLSKLHSHLWVGGAIVGNKLTENGSKLVENTLIGRMLGGPYLGSFSLANQVPRFLAESMLNALWLNLYVQALHAETDDSRFRAYQRLSRIIGLGLFPVAALICAESDIFIEIFLGSAWSNMSPLFQLLLVSYSISTIGILGSALTYAKGLTALQLRVTVETAVLRFLVVVSVRWLGVHILLVGLPLANIFLFWRSLTVSCRIVEGNAMQVLAPLLAPAACATITGVLCWSAVHAVSPNLIVLAALFVGGGVFYVALLMLMDKKRIMKDLREFRQIMQENIEPVAQPLTDCAIK